MSALVFDVETTGLPDQISFGEWYSWKDTKKYYYSRIVQFSCILYDLEKQKVIEVIDYVIRPDYKYKIPNAHIHGITHDKAVNEGVPFHHVTKQLRNLLKSHKISFLVAHNIGFDLNVLLSELYRRKKPNLIERVLALPQFCTMEKGRIMLQECKVPKLDELFEHCTGGQKRCDYERHNSFHDSEATLLCFLHLLKSSK